MTESEYITVANRVKVSAALTIMRDVLAGDDWGISDQCLAEIVSGLDKANDALFAAINID